MKRLLLPLTAAAVLAVGLLAAWLTMAHWYRPWMPAALGRAVFPLEHVAEVREAAARNALDPALVAAVIYTESRFNDSVESRRGAVGLMQIMPSTAEEIARQSGGTRFEPADLSVPRVNILYGCFYLRRLLDHYGGSLVAALAAYNAGAANVDKWVAGPSVHGLSVADIPFTETRTYVARVLRLRDIYRHIYAASLNG